MDRIGRWKLADELTAYQIALLIAGYDPSEFERDQPQHWPGEVQEDISPFLSAVKNAARSGKLKFTPVRYENTYNSDDIDWSESTIEINSLCHWLELRNFQDGYFVAAQAQVDKLADASCEFYAPKLAAAVRAWNEVTADPEALNGKTPKKALEIWLRKHANEYGLTGKDGNPNALGIEEICKVANWKPGGGASPTPTQPQDRSLSGPPQESRSNWARKVRPNSRTRPALQLLPPTDDDIPF